MKAPKCSMEQTEKVLLKPRTVAAMADLSLSTIYKLISQGALESVSFGRAVRDPAAALALFLKGFGKAVK